MSEVIDIVLNAVDKATGEVKKVTNSLSNLFKTSSAGKFSFTELTSAISIAQQALAQAQKVYGEVIQKNVDYALSVDRGSRLLRMSADEYSRLTQAADDFGISQETLQESLKLALKNGFVPTLENISKLSEEYNSIKDPIEAAALMTSKYGRSWMEIEPMLKKGGDAIRKAGEEAYKTGKVLDEKAIQEAENYRVAMDELTDAAGRFSAMAGQILIPYVTNIIEEMTSATRITDDFGKGIEGVSKLMSYSMGFGFFIDGMNKTEEVTKNALARLQEIERTKGPVTDTFMEIRNAGVTGMQDVATAAEDAAKKIEDENKAVTELHTSYLKNVDDLQSKENSYNDKLEELYNKRKELEKDLLDVKQDGSEKSSEDTEKILADAADVDASIQKTIIEKQKQTDAFVINMVEQRMARDGLLDDAELEYILQLKLDHGLLTQEVVDNYHAMFRAADEYMKAYTGFPDKTIHITTVYTNEYGQRAVGSAPGRASGGPVKAGMPYTVGERGIETFVPNQSGNIIPNGKSVSGNTYNITLNYSPAVSLMDRAEAEQKLMPYIEAAVRKARR